jgi:hypothetical protein
MDAIYAVVKDDSYAEDRSAKFFTPSIGKAKERARKGVEEDGSELTIYRVDMDTDEHGLFKPEHVVAIASMENGKFTWYVPGKENSREYEPAVDF